MNALSTIAGVAETKLVSSASASLPAISPTLLILRPHELIQLLPSFKALAQSPIVLQISTHQDHAQVLALRGSGLALLYSADDREAVVNAQVAARVAATGRGVVHFGEFAVAVYPESTDSIAKLNGTLDGSKPSTASTFAAAYASLPPHSAAPYTFAGDAAPSTLIVALGNTSALVPALPTTVALLSLSLYRPLSSALVRSLIPASVKTVVVLEQIAASHTKWSPVFLDVVGAFAEVDDEAPVVLSGILGRVTDSAAAIQTISGEFRSTFFPIEN